MATVWKRIITSGDATFDGTLGVAGNATFAGNVTVGTLQLSDGDAKIWQENADDVSIYAADDINIKTRWCRFLNPASSDAEYARISYNGGWVPSGFHIGGTALGSSTLEVTGTMSVSGNATFAGTITAGTGNHRIGDFRYWDSGDYAGRTGIKITNPKVALHVGEVTTSVGPCHPYVSMAIEDNGMTGLQFISGNDTETPICFGDAASYNAGNITYNHSNNAMTFGVGGAGALALTLDSSQNATFAGNVGINGITPTKKLQIIDDSSSVLTMFQIKQDSDGNGDASMAFTIPATNFAIGIDNTDDCFKISNTVDDVGNNSRFIMTPAGNVGIGLPSNVGTPNTKFIVNHNDETSVLFNRTGASGGDHNIMMNTDRVVNNRNQILFNVSTNGYQGGYGESGATTYAGISTKVTEIVSSTVLKGQMSFYVNTGVAPYIQTALTLDSSKNATFTGNATAPRFIATGSSGIGLGLQTDNVALALGSGTDFKMWHDGNTNLWNYVGGGSLKFGTNNSIALTLNTSQNATFAGHLIAAADKGLWFASNYRTGYQGNESTDTLTLITDNVARLTINNTTATFAGTITSGAITSTGTITGTLFDAVVPIPSDQCWTLSPVSISWFIS